MREERREDWPLRIRHPVVVHPAWRLQRVDQTVDLEVVERKAEILESEHPGNHVAGFMGGGDRINEVSADLFFPIIGIVKLTHNVSPF
jgi:hypothetical protein